MFRGNIQVFSWICVMKPRPTVASRISKAWSQASKVRNLTCFIICISFRYSSQI